VVDDLAARYADSREHLATIVAATAGVQAKALAEVWSHTSDTRVEVVYAALAQVGDPYVWGAVGPDTFDCSGLTGFAWKVAGVDLPHYTVTQRQATLDVAETALRPGDLVFNLDGPNGGHVMLFLGVDHAVVHAPAPGTLVSVGQWRTTTGFGSPIADDDHATASADASAA
jgi:cell wall-associated NlpC family hydrolase